MMSLKLTNNESSASSHKPKQSEELSRVILHPEQQLVVAQRKPR